MDCGQGVGVLRGRCRTVSWSHEFMCYPIDIIWEKARSKGLYQPGMTSNWRCLHVLLLEPLRTFCTNVPYLVLYSHKSPDIRDIKLFSRISDILGKLRKKARFSDLNIRRWRATTNCKLYKRCECHARFRSMILSVFSY